MMKSIRLGIGVTAAVATGLLLVSHPAAADAAERAFEMKAYVDYAGGRQVIAGDYAVAIQAASRAAEQDGERGMIANTNLCVAFTKTGQFARAEAACTRALTLAERSRVSVPLLRYGYDVRQQDIVTALSNRGVLRAVSGDPLGAARDFREATGVAGTAVDVPRRNLTYLEASVADRVAMNEERRGRE